MTTNDHPHCRVVGWIFSIAFFLWGVFDVENAITHRVRGAGWPEHNQRAPSLSPSAPKAMPVMGVTDFSAIGLCFLGGLSLT